YIQVHLRGCRQLVLDGRRHAEGVGVILLEDQSLRQLRPEAINRCRGGLDRLHASVLTQFKRVSATFRKGQLDDPPLIVGTRPEGFTLDVSISVAGVQVRAVRASRTDVVDEEDLVDGVAKSTSDARNT